LASSLSLHMLAGCVIRNICNRIQYGDHLSAMDLVWIAQVGVGVGLTNFIASYLGDHPMSTG
jgi:hypothetical protein